MPYCCFITPKKCEMFSHRRVRSGFPGFLSDPNILGEITHDNKEPRKYRSRFRFLLYNRANIILLYYKESLFIMPDSSIRDNFKNGPVGDFLSEAITPNSSVSIVSAFFTIYAYHKLREKLNSIKELRFLFGDPAFIQAVDPEKNEEVPSMQENFQDI